eukprot:TRINITY_DN55893_c0_g1_i1.p1 TRINITY_DN55893_c0_g1~~TRINITY_DN55893_c0_g1_i1.p1  ORF type:complete len:117 (-),score=15.72 TRINITY_DN55893_c0_g1_i1:35-385(-)
MSSPLPVTVGSGTLVALAALNSFFGARADHPLLSGFSEKASRHNTSILLLAIALSIRGLRKKECEQDRAVINLLQWLGLGLLINAIISLAATRGRHFSGPLQLLAAVAIIKNLRIL